MSRTLHDIETKLGQIIEEVTLGAVSRSSVNSELRLMDDLGLDSLDYASVMLSCEKWLQCKVNEAQVDWRGVRTVGQLAEVMCRSQKLG